MAQNSALKEGLGVWRRELYTWGSFVYYMLRPLIVLSSAAEPDPASTPFLQDPSPSAGLAFLGSSCPGLFLPFTSPRTLLLSSFLPRACSRADALHAVFWRVNEGRFEGFGCAEARQLIVQSSDSASSTLMLSS